MPLFFLGGKNELCFCLYSMQIIEETRFAEIRPEQSAIRFLQRDLCSMFVLVTHVKFCSLWRHQFTVSEMEAIPAAMLFVLLVNLIFFE